MRQQDPWKRDWDIIRIRHFPPADQQPTINIGGKVSENPVMHIRQIPESGSYARFFFELIAMYLIASAFAFCVIAAAYAQEKSPNGPAAILVADASAVR